MMRLEELVAAVLNEFAIAQTKAALFSAQLGADFHRHDILKHLPVPAFAIKEAEINVPIALSETDAETPLVVSAKLNASDLIAAVEKVTGALRRQKSLRYILQDVIDDDDFWRRTTSEISTRLAKNTRISLSVDALSMLFGCLFNIHYLLNLLENANKFGLEKAQKTAGTSGKKQLEILERIAIDLMKQELHDRLEEKAKSYARLKGKLRKNDASSPDLYHGRSELQDTGVVPMLRIRLHEEDLESLTSSETGKTRNEGQ